MSNSVPALVTTQWLEDHLTAPDIRVVDASWHMPGAKRNPLAEYDQAHIPGAVFFDIDEISDQDSPLPHMMPSPEKMASRMRRLGLGDGVRVIIYDNSDLRSAARAWFMVKTFGHGDVAILDGGFQKWQNEDRVTDDLPPVPKERHFTPRFNNTKIRDLGQMLNNLNTKTAQVVDARNPGRFTGQTPEPRSDLRGGAIPGSKNVFFKSLLREDGTFKSPKDIRALFEAAGVDLNKPIVTSCGSGLTAAVLMLGLYLVGHQNNALYDGSWTEWGGKSDTPIVKQK